MNQRTRRRVDAALEEIQNLAYMARRSAKPAEYVKRIDTLARECCDYFVFGFEAPDEHRTDITV